MSRANQQYVIGLCEEVLGFPASSEHRFDWLRGDPSPKTGKSVRLPVDAYWEDLQLVVEFNERQHYEPVAHFDKPDVLTVSGVHRGIQRRLYEERRAELVPQHGLSLVIIRMDEFEVRHNQIVRRPDADRSIVAGHLSPFIPAG